MEITAAMSTTRDTFLIITGRSNRQELEIWQIFAAYNEINNLKFNPIAEISLLYENLNLFSALHVSFLIVKRN